MKYKCCEKTISEYPGEGEGRSKNFLERKNIVHFFITQTFMEFIKLICCICYEDELQKTWGRRSLRRFIQFTLLVVLLSMIVQANLKNFKLGQLQKILVGYLGKNRNIMVDVKSNIIPSSSKKKGEELGVWSILKSPNLNGRLKILFQKQIIFSRLLL